MSLEEKVVTHNFKSDLPLEFEFYKYYFYIDLSSKIISHISFNTFQKQISECSTKNFVHDFSEMHIPVNIGLGSMIYTANES